MISCFNICIALFYWYFVGYLVVTKKVMMNPICSLFSAKQKVNYHNFNEFMLAVYCLQMLEIFDEIENR